MYTFTTEFLENILRTNENDDSIKVTKFNSNLACKKEDNFASIVKRITIEGTKIVNNCTSDFTINLITKEPQEFLLQPRQYVEMFRNEVVTYGKILPAICCYYNNPLNVPKYFHLKDNLIVLEDFVEKGYTMQQDHYMTIQQCEIIMQQLANFHASSIVLKEKDPIQFNLVANELTEFIQKDNTLIAQLADDRLSLILKLLKTQTKQIAMVTKAIEKMSILKSEILDKVCKLMNANYEISALNHGDFWRNNILFGTRDGNIDTKFIDLQCVRYTSVAADLSFFLHINIESKTRHANLNLFLKKYLEALHSNLSDHNIEFDKNRFSLDVLKKEMNEFSLYAFLYHLFILPVFYLKNDEISDLESEKHNTSNNQTNTANNMTPELADAFLNVVFDFMDNYVF